MYVRKKKYYPVFFISHWCFRGAIINVVVYFGLNKCYYFSTITIYFFSNTRIVSSVSLFKERKILRILLVKIIIFSNNIENYRTLNLGIILTIKSRCKKFIISLFKQRKI